MKNITIAINSTNTTFCINDHMLNQHSFPYEDVPYLCHALVLIHGHKLVAHAMNQKNGHSELSMIDLIPLRPVLATHHGSQDKRRHIEGIALF